LNAATFLCILFVSVVLSFALLHGKSNASIEDYSVSIIVFFFAFLSIWYGVYKLRNDKYNLEVMRTNEENQKLEDIRKKESVEKYYLQLIKKNESAISDFKKNFEVVDTRTFGDILLKNQSKIEKEYILNLVKLDDYLKTKKKSIEKQKKLIIDLNIYEIETSVEPEIELIYKQNDYLRNLGGLSVKMIDTLLDGKLVLFYSIFNQFDKLGIFNKEWENQLLGLMGEINSNLLSVIDEIGLLEASVSSSIYDLQLEIISKE